MVRNNSKVEVIRQGGKGFAAAAGLATILLAGCSKAQSGSVLGDAAHPTPVHFYTVAEETARRRIQAVGSLFALEESALSSQVDGSSQSKAGRSPGLFFRVEPSGWHTGRARTGLDRRRGRTSRGSTRRRALARTGRCRAAAKA